MTEQWTEYNGIEGAHYIHDMPLTFTCGKCGNSVSTNDHFWKIETPTDTHHMHDSCYSTYEHYYGYGKPLD